MRLILTVGVVITLSLIAFLITNPSTSTSGSSLSSSIEISRLDFSGLPNPSVSIDPGVIEELVLRLDGIPRTSPPSWAGSPFGGFLVVNPGEDTRLPPMARVFLGVIEIPGLVDEEGNPVFYEDVHGLEDFLRGFFSDPVASTVSSIPEETEEPSFSLLAYTTTATAVAATAMVTQQQLPLSGAEPPYEPWKWNVLDRLRAIGALERITRAVAEAIGLQVGGTAGWRAFWRAVEKEALRDAVAAQSLNNCYNYACNRRTDTLFGAQPGRGSLADGVAGNDYTPPSGWRTRDLNGNGNIEIEERFWKPQDIACDNLTAAAKADGLQQVDCNKKCPKNSYKKALVVAPGVDYHWYRQDNNGNWSHKPGSTPATNLDAGNPSRRIPPKVITDPRQAERNYQPWGGPNYSAFCGCFCCGPNVNKR